jgi:hypothetical protein
MKQARLNKGKKSCDKCGATGLFWRQSKRGNWVLFEEVADRDEEGFTVSTDTRAHFAFCGEDVENTAPKTAQKPAPPMEPEVKAAVLRAVQLIAHRCDGARSLDSRGFSRYDAEFGHDLAMNDDLTDRQAAAAQKMVRKYRGQLIDAGYDDLAAEAGLL